MANSQWDEGEVRLAVVGLGYVGLPLAVEFGKHFDTVGFDVNQQRVAELSRGTDHTLEVTSADLTASSRLRFTSAADDIAEANFYIVTVPTPVDGSKRPDLTPLIKASASIGQYLKQGDIVVYESTVYPGATEEVCVPILEETSGLKLNQGFFAGYSPERINPGDQEHRLPNITKITSGSSPECADFVDRIYNRIITAGTHRAGSIKIAEAAKVIENTQRDLNIALVNELAMIFNRMEIDTEAVLAAAGTKWNFLNFKPGLVGGHCIGVDPYYLTYKAQQIGYMPEVILAGRRINDGMGQYVVSRIVKLMIGKRIHVADARVLILGLAFKENCGDTRNTRVIDIVTEMRSYGAEVDVHDPRVDPKEVQREYGLSLVSDPQPGQYDAIILAVAHSEFQSMTLEQLKAFGRENHVLYLVKPLYPGAAVDGRL